jgi:hypothetical protein
MGNVWLDKDKEEIDLTKIALNPISPPAIVNYLHPSLTISTSGGISYNEITPTLPSTTHQLANHPLPNTAVPGEIKINGITIQTFYFDTQDALLLNMVGPPTKTYVIGGKIYRDTGTIVFLWSFNNPNPPNTLQVVVNYKF